MTSKRDAPVPPDAEHAAAWLERKQGAMEEAIAELVRVNSFTDNVEGGRASGRLVRELFAVPGLTCSVRPSTRFADHLVFTTGEPSDTRAPVALVGHLDTVFPPGTFEGYERHGAVARGPGVLDMKGGLVVIAFALKAVASTAGLARVAPLRVVVVADEEVGSPEGQGVLRDALSGSRACLVFEAGRAGDAIITRRKGTGALTVAAHGVAAHAGNQHRDGKNAIWALARFIDRAQRLTDYDRGVTVNVGKVVGGHGKNTVPDLAEAWLDFRFCAKEDADAVMRALERAASEAAQEVEGTRLLTEGGIARLPLERSPASVALMAEYATCARASGLGDSEAPLIGGGSDANTASGLGIPAIDGLGPRGRGFHTKDEQIELGSLVPKAQALARFLLLGVVSLGIVLGAVV